MLSKTKYAALCVLGTEIFYSFCIGYGWVLSGKAMELHHSLFELMPGFRLGKSVEHGLGRSLSRDFGMDWRLVYRVDAQCESERRK